MSLDSSDRLLSVLAFLPVRVSVRFLIFHYEDSNAHKETNHQQYSSDTSDNHSIHIHFASPSGNKLD